MEMREGLCPVNAEKEEGSQLVADGCFPADPKCKVETPKP